MERKKQPSVSEDAKKSLKREANIARLEREYDQAILDAAEKYKVNDLSIIEIKDGKIYISGWTPEEWERIHSKDDDTPYYRGQG